MKKTVEITILENGEILVSRQDREANPHIVEILSKIGLEDKEDNWKTFFNNSNNSELNLLGNVGEFSDKSWCG